jgi:hypothetical protein
VGREQTESVAPLLPTPRVACEMHYIVSEGAIAEVVVRKKNRAGASISRAWVDRDDAPELTDEHFKRADVYRGERLVRRGRPRRERPNQVGMKCDEGPR